MCCVMSQPLRAVLAAESWHPVPLSDVASRSPRTCVDGQILSFHSPFVSSLSERAKLRGDPRHLAISVLPVRSFSGTSPSLPFSQAPVRLYLSRKTCDLRFMRRWCPAHLDGCASSSCVQTSYAAQRPPDDGSGDTATSLSSGTVATLSKRSHRRISIPSGSRCP